MSSPFAVQSGWLDLELSPRPYCSYIQMLRTSATLHYYIRERKGERKRVTTQRIYIYNTDRDFHNKRKLFRHSGKIFMCPSSCLSTTIVALQATRRLIYKRRIASVLECDFAETTASNSEKCGGPRVHGTAY